MIKQTVKIELCPSPLLYTAYAARMDRPTTIVVDVLRASTTIVEALANGAQQIIIVASVDEAQAYASKGYLVGAERNAQRCSFAQLGNDPGEYTREVVAGRTIVFSTTNGTLSISTACREGAGEILVGGYINLPAILKYLIQEQRREIIVLAAGWQGTVSCEDSLFAGSLLRSLQKADIVVEAGDAAQMAADLWDKYGQDIDQLRGYIAESEHYKRLQRLRLEDSVTYCISPTIESVVPIVIRHEDQWVAQRVHQT